MSYGCNSCAIGTELRAAGTRFAVMRLLCHWEASLSAFVGENLPPWWQIQACRQLPLRERQVSAWLTNF